MNVANTTYDGKEVIVSGYIYSYSTSYSNFNFQLISIEELTDPGDPTLTVSTEELTWDADVRGIDEVQTFSVTLNENAAGYTVEYTDTNLEWNVSDNGSGTVSVYPQEYNTGTSAKTLVITVKHQDDESVTATVTCKQKGTGAEPTLQYTLDGTTTGGSNGYATVSEITQNDISWGVTGNTTMNPWRIGGKSLTAIDRVIYSKTAISADISSIILTHGTASSITVNSVTVTVHSTAADAESGSNAIATFTPTFKASDSVTVTKTDSADWSGKFYRISRNFHTLSFYKSTTLQYCWIYRTVCLTRHRIRRKSYFFRIN